MSITIPIENILMLIFNIHFNIPKIIINAIAKIISSTIISSPHNQQHIKVYKSSSPLNHPTIATIILITIPKRKSFQLILIKNFKIVNNTNNTIAIKHTLLSCIFSPLFKYPYFIYGYSIIICFLFLNKLTVIYFLIGQFFNLIYSSLIR